VYVIRSRQLPSKSYADNDTESRSESQSRLDQLPLAPLSLTSKGEMVTGGTGELCHILAVKSMYAPSLPNFLPCGASQDPGEPPLSGTPWP